MWFYCHDELSYCAVDIMQYKFIQPLYSNELSTHKIVKLWCNKLFTGDYNYDAGQKMLTLCSTLVQLSTTNNKSIYTIQILHKL